MASIPKLLSDLIKRNETLIKEKCGEPFFYRIVQGDVTHLDLQIVEQTIRAAALEK